MRHPNDALQKTGTTQPGSPELADDELKKWHWERCVSWDGRRFRVTGGQKWHRVLHPMVVDNLKDLVLTANPPPFNATIQSGDNGWHVGTSNQLVHSANPSGWEHRTAVLPLHPHHANAAKTIQPASTVFHWQENATRTCRWAGANSGYAIFQNVLNANRTLCATNETDRMCVGRLKPDGFAFGRRKNIFSASVCLLAIDGNSWSSIFFQGLL